MILLIDEANRCAVESLWDDRLAVLPEIEASDALPVSVSLLKRIPFPIDARLFTPQAIADTSFRVAIGGDGSLPRAGTFTLTFTADDDTEEETEALSPQPDAAEIEAELNAGAEMTAAGGVVVTGAAGFFVVTWNEEGARNLLTGDASGLVPLSLLDIRRAVTGDDSTREVQTIRILRNAGANSTIDTANDAADATLEVVAAGGTGVNTQLRVTLTGDPYRGSWTFSKANPGGAATSQAILWDDSPAQIETKLAAIVGVGTGNVEVTQEAEGQFFIEFIGALAGIAITTPAVNGANLVALPTLSGTLDLTAPGIDYLLCDEKGEPVESKVVMLEVEKTVGTDSPVKVLSQAVVLRRAVLSAGSTITDNDDMPVGTETLHNLTGFTGGGAANVDGAAVTRGRQIGRLYRGVVDDVLYEWELRAGTAASNAPMVIRPTDYNASTNAVNLIQVGG